MSNNDKINAVISKDGLSCQLVVCGRNVATVLLYTDLCQEDKQRLIECIAVAINAGAKNVGETTDEQLCVNGVILKEVKEIGIVDSNDGSVFIHRDCEE
jgi:hypothetical protein